MLSLRRRQRFSQFSDREQAYALALIMVGIVLVTVATVAILIEDAARQDARESPRMLGPPAEETPDRSDSRSGPVTVLPQIEEIVSSFDVLVSGADVPE